MSQQIPPPMPLQYATPPDGSSTLRVIAGAQRRMIWAILGAFLVGISAAMGAAITANSPLGLDLTVFLLYLVRLGFVVFMMVCVYQLSAALGDGMSKRVLLVIGMLLPLISLIILLVVNQMATKTLKSHGIRVGFMGAKLADLEGK